MMLRSDERWKNIKFEGVYRFRNSDGSIGETWSNGSIMQSSKIGPYMVNLTISLQKGGDSNQKIFLDGTTVWDTYPKYKIFSSQPINFGMIPPTALPTINDPEHPTILHPLVTQVPNPFMEWIFPQGMAQQIAVQSKGGKISILGEDEIAGRKTVIIQFNQDWASRLNLWVDQSTGIVLKIQMFDKFGIEKNQWGDEIEITSIQFNLANVDAVFTFDETGYTKMDSKELDRRISELKSSSGEAK